MQIFTDYPFADLEAQAGFVDDVEAAGYSGVFATENRHDPFLAVAASARRSRAVHLGVAVTALLARNPFTVAQMAWDLHYNTGEHFILGVGTHQDVHLAARLGVSPENKYERLVEAVAAIREIWASWLEDRGPNFHGDYYAIHTCPPGYRPTTRLSSLPPVFHLCSTEQDLTVAASHLVDGIFLHPTWVPRYVDRVICSKVLSCRANGKTFPVIDGGIISTGLTNNDLDQSRAQARSRIADYWLKKEYNYVYADVGAIDAVMRFRREHEAGTVDWDAAYVEELFHTFVCEARLKDLGKRLEQRCSSAVTGLFPNVVSAMPRLLPKEIVADLCRVTPMQKIDLCSVGASYSWSVSGASTQDRLVQRAAKAERRS